MLRHAGDTLAAQPSGATATVGRSWFYSVALESLTPSRNRVAAVARLIFSQLESAHPMLQFVAPNASKTWLHCSLTAL